MSASFIDRFLRSQSKSPTYLVPRPAQACAWVLFPLGEEIIDLPHQIDHWNRCSEDYLSARSVIAITEFVVALTENHT